MNFNEITKNDSYEQLHELIDSHVHFLHELNVEFHKGRQSSSFKRKRQLLLNVIYRQLNSWRKQENGEYAKILVIIVKVVQIEIEIEIF